MAGIITGVRKALQPAKRWYWESAARDRAVGMISGLSRARHAIETSKRIVLLVVPGRDFVNGGIMSICSIAAESRKLKDVHQAEVVVCTAHGQPRLRRFTKFDNDEEVLAFDDVLAWIPPGAKVLVHSPEVHTEEYVLGAQELIRCRSDIDWQFNILLQNIDLIPPRDVVARMQELGPVTATTAHATYATDETAERLGCPVQLLSTWLRPEAFDRVPYSQKRKTIVISNDPYDAKPRIVQALQEGMPDHKIIEIQSMTYRTYRRIIKYAKFTFTFGEGLDGYFVETSFSGGVSMAVYNDRFFSPRYKSVDGVFADADAAVSQVGPFMRGLDADSGAYEAVWRQQFTAASTDFNGAIYLEMLRAFYEDHFRA